jgi:hypothetical protein
MLTAYQRFPTSAVPNSDKSRNMQGISAFDIQTASPRGSIMRNRTASFAALRTVSTIVCVFAAALLPLSPAAFAKNYQPGDLVRLAPSDLPRTGFNRVGETVAAYSTTLVVAAPGADSGQGAVYVYERRSTVQWDEMAKLIAPDGVPGFGQDVDISANTIIVKHNSAIQIFVRNGASWVHQARIELSDKPDVDAAIDGNRLFLINRRTGFAHAYRRSNGVWTRQMTVGPDVNAPKFHDVAMGGGLVVLGAPTGTGGLIELLPAGSAYVFRLKAVAGQKDVWVREARLHPPAMASAAGGFGLSLDVSSNRVAVASRFEQDIRGSVYVFARGTNGVWKQTARLLPVDGLRHCFGWTVAIHHDRIAVSSPCLSDGQPQSGVRSVDVFQRNSGLETWRRLDRLFTGEGAVPIGTALSNCGTYMGVPDAGFQTDTRDVTYVQPSTVCAAPITP